MNSKKLVKLSNIVGAITILLLIYWVFIFITIQVFKLKVFSENITDTFFMSILGILALMSGVLIINIMFNLTRIAEKHNKDELMEVKTNSKKLSLLFGLSFPLIFGLLFIGDYLTSQKKEKLLIQSAQSIITDNTLKADKLLNYQFTELWMLSTDEILEVLSKTDENFPHVSVIVKDNIDNSTVFLQFHNYYGELNDTIKPSKKNFIFDTTKAERDYLKKVFEEKSNETFFRAHDGNYELYYPYIKNNKRIVLYFSDYQRYGKIGS
ncbi:MAG: hypothetical protein K2X86_10060 [Cytophagaceae bacterium]|nr:hypothetical protein [Cytophagaceae bacterium]